MLCFYSLNEIFAFELCQLCYCYAVLCCVVLCCVVLCCVVLCCVVLCCVVLCCVLLLDLCCKTQHREKYLHPEAIWRRSTYCMSPTEHWCKYSGSEPLRD